MIPCEEFATESNKMNRASLSVRNPASSSVVMISVKYFIVTPEIVGNCVHVPIFHLCKPVYKRYRLQSKSKSTPSCKNQVHMDMINAQVPKNQSLLLRK